MLAPMMTALALAEIAVGDDSADDRREIGAGRVDAVDERGLRLPDQQLLGHVIDQQRAHPVVGELLPHVREEQDGQATRLAEPASVPCAHATCTLPEPQTSGPAVIIAVLVNDAWRPVLGEEGRAVEVDDVAALAEDESRRHRQAGADHVADHDAQARAARASAAINSPSVRPPHLSSLILTTSKRPTAPATSSSVSRLSSPAIGTGDLIALEFGLAAARQRLLEQRDALLHQAPRPARRAAR